MRCTNPNQKKATAFYYLMAPAILVVLVMAASGSLSHAQSGRKEAQTQDDTTASRISPKPSNQKNPRELPTAFIVATAVPDHLLPPGFYPGYAQPPSFEYHARGGCLIELRSIPNAKVIEDEDVERWEARQTALAEDKAWVIWMELRWDKPGSRDSSLFRLRYLLFEPKTGKIAASGYGNGVRKTWGRDPKRTTLEEQLREAGRDIARQVMSELKGESLN